VPNDAQKRGRASITKSAVPGTMRRQIPMDCDSGRFLNRCHQPVGETVFWVTQQLTARSDKRPRHQSGVERGREREQRGKAEQPQSRKTSRGNCHVKSHAGNAPRRCSTRVMSRARTNGLSTADVACFSRLTPPGCRNERESGFIVILSLLAPVRLYGTAPSCRSASPHTSSPDVAPQQFLPQPLCFQSP
jgi:hypothetical protein